VIACQLFLGVAILHGEVEMEVEGSVLPLVTSAATVTRLRSLAESSVRSHLPERDRRRTRTGPETLAGCGRDGDLSNEPWPWQKSAVDQHVFLEAASGIEPLYRALQALA
jgi:hypothetical protein